MTPISAPEDIGALWLQTLQRAIGRASHDVKDALNGVSVNVEVIRSRAAKPDMPASSVLKFGDAAGQQLERLTILLDAILALARPYRPRPDVAVILRRVVTLCGASSSPRDAAIHLSESDEIGSTATVVAADAVRLALTSILLELAVGTDPAMRLSEISCRLSSVAEGLEVVIAAAGRRPSMPDSIAEVLKAAGVRWIDGEDRISLIFPRA